MIEDIIGRISSIERAVASLSGGIVYGTVTQASPLRVRLDGDTAALAYTPSVLKGLLFAVDDRVVCLMDKRLVVLGTVAAADTWHAVSFVNSWVNYGSPYFNAEYTKMPSGLVRLHGRVHVAGEVRSAPSAIFTLPAGYRPASQMEFGCAGSSATYAQVSVTAAGVVTFVGGAEPILLDGISFQVG